MAAPAPRGNHRGWKNKCLSPDEIPQTDKHAFNERGAQLYQQYQERLNTLNAVDFGDLIMRVVNIFRTHDDLLLQYRRRFKYILVDEYQDTNTAQYLWLKLLAGGHGNICCVGDDDQSIYGWRGAVIDNILQFERSFAGARVVRLEQNYRSTSHILAAASAVIANNRGRLGKNALDRQTGRQKGPGHRPHGFQHGSEMDRAGNRSDFRWRRKPDRPPIQ